MIRGYHHAGLHGKIVPEPVDISQTLYSRDQPVAEKSLGQMVFQRPGKFFWAYESPYEQEIVSNGKHLWVYDKDLEQVTVREVNEELKQTPILLLDEPDKINDVYDMVVNTMADDLVAVQLLPKQESAGFRRVMLVFESAVLSGMEIEDNFDQYNRINFHDVKKNPVIDAQQFQLHIPDGVDVIHATEESD